MRIRKQIQYLVPRISNTEKSSCLGVSTAYWQNETSGENAGATPWMRALASARHAMRIAAIGFATKGETRAAISQ